MIRIKRGTVCLSVFMMMLCCRVEAQAADPSDTILPGVYIGTADVSGMTRTEAQEAVEQQVEEMMEDEITFHMQDETFTTSAASLGYRWINENVVDKAMSYGKSGNIVSRYKISKDLKETHQVIPLEGTVDNAVIEEILEDNCTQYNKDVKNMSLEHEDGVFTVVPGEAGCELNVGASVSVISDYMTDQWTGGDTDINLIEEIQQPRGTKEELEEVRDVLGSSSTDYSSSNNNRRKNVENGVSKIDGAILYPGESLSVLDEVLPFEEENGYAEAASYLKGEVVDSIGGGVCQVSTTLYLSVIRAELQVDTRYNHSMKVGYVKPSMDAAVAEGSKDFVFTNDTDTPIYIEGKAEDDMVAFTVYGKETRAPGREVTFESETIPSDDPEVALEAKLWKIVTENGEETKTEFNHSTYYVQKAKNKQKRDSE